MNSKTFRRAGLVLAATVLLLQGCGTASLSRQIADDGSSAEALVFPDAQQNAWRKDGSFPAPANLAHVAPGVTKDQLYELLGRPHFREGMVGVREWDYVFHFRSASGVKTCQYKVLFDTQFVARSFHWQPAACADLMK